MVESPPESTEESARSLIYITDDGQDPPKFTIVTRLVHVVAPVQNELQLILDRTRLALESSAAAPAFSGQFQDAHFHIDPAKNRRLPLDDLKVETRKWLLKSAFQSAMELVNFPLEQARRLLALWDMAQRHARGESVRLDFEDDAAWFHKRPFEQKLTFLRERYAFQIDAGAVAVVLSLHKARNCVVHRLGMVSAIDCDSAAGVLKASWEEYAVFASPSRADWQNAARVDFGGHVKVGQAVHMRRLTKVREFKPGDLIELTPQDLNEICHTIHLFASQVRDDLRKKSESLGFPMEGKLEGPRLGRH